MFYHRSLSTDPSWNPFDSGIIKLLVSPEAFDFSLERENSEADAAIKLHGRFPVIDRPVGWIVRVGARPQRWIAHPPQLAAPIVSPELATAGKSILYVYTKGSCSPGGP